MIQRRKSTKTFEAAIEATKSFDAFPKIEDDYIETSSTRGTLSILVFFAISFLVVSEIRDFYQEQLHYSYEVDFDYLSKLKLNFDITVATRCDLIGADVLDSTSVLLTNQPVNMTNTWFELSGNQQAEFDSITKLNNHIRSNYHALHSALWLTPPKNIISEREIIPNYPKNACRVQGIMELNKVLGLFHIISGKAINIMGQHGHALNMGQRSAANFSHRIDNFSFGEYSNSVHNALNYELKVDKVPTMYQYFVSVVATEVGTVKTYQYSVTERVTPVDHSSGHHGQAGIFFKYDISPVKVKVNLDKRSYLDLLIPLIGIVGGIFATSNMINSLFESIKESFSK